jgi:hypothetical protein
VFDSGEVKYLWKNLPKVDLFLRVLLESEEISMLSKGFQLSLTWSSNSKSPPHPIGGEVYFYKNL